MILLRHKVIGGTVMKDFYLDLNVFFSCWAFISHLWAAFSCWFSILWFFFKRLAKPADKREWKDTQPFLFLSPSWLSLAYQPISLHGNKSALQGAAAGGQCCGWAGASGQNGPLGLWGLPPTEARICMDQTRQERKRFWVCLSGKMAHKSLRRNPESDKWMCERKS